MFGSCSVWFDMFVNSSCSVRFVTEPSSDMKFCSIKLSNIVRFVKILFEFDKSSSEFVRVRFAYSSNSSKTFVQSILSVPTLSPNTSFKCKFTLK